MRGYADCGWLFVAVNYLLEGLTDNSNSPIMGNYVWPGTLATIEHQFFRIWYGLPMPPTLYLKQLTICTGAKRSASGPKGRRT